LQVIAKLTITGVMGKFGARRRRFGGLPTGRRTCSEGMTDGDSERGMLQLLEAA